MAGSRAKALILTKNAIWREDRVSTPQQSGVAAEESRVGLSAAVRRGARHEGLIGH